MRRRPHLFALREISSSRLAELISVGFDSLSPEPNVHVSMYSARHLTNLE